RTGAIRGVAASRNRGFGRAAGAVGQRSRFGRAPRPVDLRRSKSDFGNGKPAAAGPGSAEPGLGPNHVAGSAFPLRLRYPERGAMSDRDLKTELNPMQYHVTQEQGTEPPFRNEFWNNHEEGLYVDVVSGEVLFSSRDKYDSGCGWPSFTKPVSGAGVV